MISIKHLSKNYSDFAVLKDVNTEINDHDVISVIGPSGTGKSTLLRCINLLETPNGGEIVIDGVNLMDKKTAVHKMRMKIGMVFQTYNLFTHKTVIENVMMAPMDLLGKSKQQAFDDGIKYLKAVGLAEKAYAMPNELSGGQKQRAAIARCLAMEPEIILFDEPTSALDPAMVSEVQSVIRELANQGRTMLIVSHDMKFSREIANRVFYMDEGIIYEDGTPEQIFENPKGEKTRAFIKKLRTVSYEIRSADYDAYEMNSKIEQFALKQLLPIKSIHNIQLVIEELIENQIIHSTQTIDLRVGYFEVENRIEISFEYGGNSYNPYDTDKEDMLSMILVRSLTSNVRYQYDDKNHLTVDIVSNSKNSNHKNTEETQ